jgi:hypothetical protein
MFNIYTQLQKELDDYFTSKISIATKTSGKDISKLGSESKGRYEFSQFETLALIDLYYNSIFDSGQYDSEGQRKIFLNICKFRSDVASKQIDLDVKDFVFVPTEATSEWGAFFLNKKFRQWARKNYFGKLINEIVNDFPKYGTVVVKRVGKVIERIPLSKLRVKQDAKNLKIADYVIEEHEMTYDEMADMGGWDLTGVNLEFGEKAKVFERYGRVPLSFYKEKKKETVTEEDKKRSVDCMCIIMPSSEDSKEKKDGQLLFIEEVDDRPYEEVHWAKIDGRWLGIGEIENQFENQIFRNMVVNMRRRGLLWSGKKVFQSPDTEIAKNLVRDVRDGEILKIMPNGNVTQVNTTTQNLGEFTSAIDEIENNSNQKSFTFEVATGEALPSGTPFRLGVVLSNSVNSHFALKRENLGLFFEEVVYEQLFPIFKKENRKEHILMFSADEEGVELLKQEVISVETSRIFKETLLSGSLPNVETIRQNVTEQIMKRKNLFMGIPEGLYDQLKASAQLVITGEGVDLAKRIETLTNLYTAMAQKQDPRADKILAKILSLTGENYDALAGVKPTEPAVAPIQSPQGMQTMLGQAMQTAGQGNIQ